MRVPEQRVQVRIALAAALALLLAGWLLYSQVRSMRQHHKLVEFLNGADVRQRTRAAVKLAALRDERAVPVLVGALTMRGGLDARPGEAVAALCKLGGTVTVRALEAALYRPGTDQSLVIQALACLDLADARAVLANSLQSGDETLLQTTVMMLSGSGDPRIVRLLLNAERRADRQRRLTILVSLADPAGRPLDPRLIQLLTVAASDPDVTVSSVAGESLRWNELDKPGSVGAWADGDELARPGDLADDALAAAARRAVAFIGARQDPSGFWPTSRSHKLGAESAVAEVNTYLTPVIVDMLDPVAAKAGLGGNMARARKQIAGEIEAGGLVRYYGSAVGAAGSDRVCAIAFDADDTALAWRIAPLSDPGKLGAALATLREFRAANGLYRTWISRADGLECVDRGSDPNPTDVGIQIHVLMFLAQASPADRQALCAALTRSIDDDRIWVYYRQEPLIPMLRQSDLAQAGCPLRVPEARIRTDIAGQGKWLAAGRALLRLAQPEAEVSDRAATIRLLQRLAQGDFAAIRRGPPLLYQNDATGKVPAFYWSQEFGYALWLRLYFETMRMGR